MPPPPAMDAAAATSTLIETLRGRASAHDSRVAVFETVTATPGATLKTSPVRFQTVSIVPKAHTRSGQVRDGWLRRCLHAQDEDLCEAGLKLCAE